MTDNPQSSEQPNLAHELAETASTLARLGVTLAGLPIAMLPRQQRTTAKQLTSELVRFASAIPQAARTMLEQKPEETEREDLGSRLRRAQREAEEAERRAASTEGDEEQLAGETPASEAVEENLQDAWESPPVDGQNR